MFSSYNNAWCTPQPFFDELNKEFNFTLDPCATPTSAKCKKFYTPTEDGLVQDWGGETVFVNPPYGRQIKKWVKKCYEESQKPNTSVVILMPSRTDTSYFHDYIYSKAEVRFIRGRITFWDMDSEKFKQGDFSGMTPAPFPSMLVIYRSKEVQMPPKITYKGKSYTIEHALDVGLIILWYKDKEGCHYRWVI